MHAFLLCSWVSTKAWSGVRLRGRDVVGSKGTHLTWGGSPATSA